MIGVNDPLERFVWRLALALGVEDPYEMLRRMPARVLNGWRRFESIEPFGPVQEDRRAGEIAAMIGTVYRDKRVHPNPFHANEFFPSLLPDEERNALIARATGTKGRPPGQLLQIMEAAFLSKGKGADNRTHRPQYEK